MSVNLSARQFQLRDLIQQIAQTLEESGLPPRCLMLEITESVVMDDAPATIITLRELQNLGVRLAIDDFGTGYSSLSYLKRFPVNTLKIDRSFVDGLGSDVEDSSIVNAIVTLSNSLGMGVTAEGIETGEQLQQLQGMLCDHGQGFFFARPLPAAEISALL